MLGGELAGSLRIVQHDARDAASHVDLGRTRGGIPILIDRFFLESDLRLVTGLIEPHLMAGYSGGRKGVCPGLAAVETVRVAHGPAMIEGQVGPGPRAKAIRSTRGCSKSCAGSACTSWSTSRSTASAAIAGVFCGDIEQAHAEGMRFVEDEALVSLDAPADLVITSGGGDPLDATFYQAIKGISAASGVVRPGGVILLCAALGEGVGSASFERLLRGFRQPAGLRAAARGRELLRDRPVDGPAPLSGAPARAHPGLLGWPSRGGAARAAGRAGGVAARGRRGGARSARPGRADRGAAAGPLRARHRPRRAALARPAAARRQVHRPSGIGAISPSHRWKLRAATPAPRAPGRSAARRRRRAPPPSFRRWRAPIFGSATRASRRAWSSSCASPRRRASPPSAPRTPSTWRIWSRRSARNSRSGAARARSPLRAACWSRPDVPSTRRARA